MRYIASHSAEPVGSAIEAGDGEADLSAVAQYVRAPRRIRLIKTIDAVVFMCLGITIANLEIGEA